MIPECLMLCLSRQTMSRYSLSSVDLCEIKKTRKYYNLDHLMAKEDKEEKEERERDKQLFLIGAVTHVTSLICIWTAR